MSTDETLSGVEGNSADVVSTEMLGDLKDETVRHAVDLEGVKDGWEVSIELHVDDGTDDL